MACCQIHTASVRLYRAPTPVIWPLRVMPSLYTSHIVDPTTFGGSNPGHNVPFRKLRMWDSAPGLVPFLWNAGPGWLGRNGPAPLWTGAVSSFHTGILALTGWFPVSRLASDRWRINAEGAAGCQRGKREPVGRAGPSQPRL